MIHIVQLTAHLQYNGNYTAMLDNTGKTIILCWIPSHVNIRGNERVDTAAKSALSLPITNIKLPACELIPRVSKFCLDKWQDIWDCCEGNKLHSIYPTVGIVKHSKNISRYDSVLLNRLQIGHSRLTHRTHSYLLSGDDSPTCQSCGIPLTVKHILVECASGTPEEPNNSCSTCSYTDFDFPIVIRCCHSSHTLCLLCSMQHSCCGRQNASSLQCSYSVIA